MSSLVCTLFEGDYHYGVAALVNSLYQHGFCGTVCAGYRGVLPPWAAGAEWCDSDSLLRISDNISISFRKLDTSHHLTNYKPTFLKEVFADHLEAQAIFYFDPDICLRESWSYCLDWITCGIILCADVNSPISEDHPRRIGWRRFYSTYGYKLKFRYETYVNAGFIGVPRAELAFIERWQAFTELMGEAIGGLSVTSISGGEVFKNKGFGNCFDIADQDALNATIEASPHSSFSTLPRSSMGFEPGFCPLPHALGQSKPWRKNYLGEVLRGFRPTTADKAFWHSAEGPIHPFPATLVQRRRVELKLAAAFGRFIHR